MIRPTPNATALRPLSRLSSLARRLPIASSWRAASVLVGDGGPDDPARSELDSDREGARSSPNEIEVMESSLTPRIGELGLADTTTSGITFEAIAIFAGRLCLGKLWTS